MIGTTDVNSRLPRFREAMDSIAVIEKAGAFEAIPDKVLDYVKAAQPVGLGEYRQVQYPDDYDPRTAPAVLMLRPHEYDYRLIFRESESERQAADAIIRQAGERTPLLPGVLSTGAALPSDFMAAMLPTGVPVIPENCHRRPFAIPMPRVIILKDADTLPTSMLGPVLAHEVDHWSFALHEIGPLQNPAQHPRYMQAQLLATEEKRAYIQTSRQIERAMGYYAELEAGVLAARYADLQPADAGRLMHASTRTADLFPDGIVPISLAVAAASLLFGKDDAPVATREEVLAYTMMGIIKTPYDLEPSALPMDETLAA